MIDNPRRIAREKATPKPANRFRRKFLGLVFGQARLMENIKFEKSPVADHVKLKSPTIPTVPRKVSTVLRFSWIRLILVPLRYTCWFRP